MVHSVREFLEGAFEREWAPTFATIERQAVGTGAEWSKSETGVGAVLVRAANDEVTAAGSYVQATCGLTRIE